MKHGLSVYIPNSYTNISLRKIKKQDEEIEVWVFIHKPQKVKLIKQNWKGIAFI